VNNETKRDESNTDYGMGETKMITVSSQSWHARVFSKWFQMKYGWARRDEINLCPYVRAVMLWFLPRYLLRSGPEWVRWCSWIGLWFLSGTIFTVLGGKTSLLRFIVVSLVCVVVAGGMVGLVYYIDWLEERKKQRRLARGDSDPAPTKFDSFLTVLRGYYKAIHDEVCPVMQIR
jgi:hypothetical protein